MSGARTALLERVRNPEYVGENRCIPCTVVNVVLALCVSALVAVVAIELAAVVFGVAVAIIAVRGYLVPGTPTLTQRYLPDSVLALFDHSADDDTDTHTYTWDTLEKVAYERRHAVDPDQFLVEVGAVDLRASDGESGDDGDDWRFTDTFAARLERHRQALRVEPPDRDLLATMLDAEPESVTVDDRDHPVITVESRIRQWPASSALCADIAANETLRGLTDRWADVPLEQRLDILESLRSVHDTCPGCGGELAVNTETVESCCRGSQDVATVVCLECSQVLLEMDPADVGSAWASDR